VEGLLMREKLVPKITAAEADEALSSIGKGMSTKVHAALEALKQGVNEVLVTSGAKKQPISSALKHKSGTVITNE
jgi:acetylglutamate kinase